MLKGPLPLLLFGSRTKVGFDLANTAHKAFVLQTPAEGLRTHMPKVLLLKLSDIGHISFGKEMGSKSGLALLQNTWATCFGPHVVEIARFLEPVDDPAHGGAMHTKFLSNVRARDSLLRKGDNACNFGGGCVDHDG